MPNLPQTIIENKFNCFVISPNVGDAAFWLGGLLADISGQTSLTVLNVFTSPQNPQTAEDALLRKQGKIKTAGRLRQLRLEEDEKALAGVGAAAKNLDISLASRGLEQQLLRSLSQAVCGPAAGLKVFCPAGLGGGREHRIIRDVCRKLFGGEQLIYWSDLAFGSAVVAPDTFWRGRNFALEPLEIADESKKNLCACYQLQPLTQRSDRELFFREEIFIRETSGQKKLETRLSAVLEKELIEQWNLFWQDCPGKNFFNSHAWFSACQKTFDYREMAVIACTENGQLAALLPLVKTRRFGAAVYASPGEKYLDHSSLLLREYDSQVLRAVLAQLKKAGNFCLDELSESAALAFCLLEGRSALPCSTGSYLELPPDPYRFLSAKSRKKFEKVFHAAKGQFRLEAHQGSVEKYLRIIRDIEAQSEKRRQRKEAFSDSSVENLLRSVSAVWEDAIETYLLYYKNEPVCYSIVYICAGTGYGFQTAYLSRHKELMPGKVLKHMLLARAFADGKTRLDFSRGGGDHKRTFTPHQYFQYAVLYCQNPLQETWLGWLLRLKSWLQRHEAVFELARKSKHVFFQDLPGIFGSRG